VSFRTRNLISSVLLVWVPLLILAWLTRTETTRMLTEEHVRRVSALTDILETDLDDWDRTIRGRLNDLKTEIKDDNRFRLAAVDEVEAEKPYLLDYTGTAMKLLGLSILRIQDASGQIVSSGHFRNEFGRKEPDLPKLLASSPEDAVLLRTRAASGPILILACVDSLRLGDRTFTLVGGVEVEKEFLSRLSPSRDIAVSLVYPAGALSNNETADEALREGIQNEDWEWKDTFPERRYITRSVDIPFALTREGSKPKLVSATFIASYPLHHLARVIRSLNLWLTGVLFASIMGTLLLSYWVSSGISRPLVALADKAGRIDLEHLDVDFRTRRRDEIGEMARLLDAMTRRLKASAQQIRTAERNATLGEVARQVNHDIRNGLTPIRNIVAHLVQVGKEEPGELPKVWKDRGEALVSSVEYLDDLANNYARFYRLNPRKLCNLNETVKEIAAGRDGIAGTRIILDLEERIPSVRADPMALRRIVDNLVSNAQDSFDREGGTVGLETRWDAEGRVVTMTVSDNGRGIPPGEIENMFRDFYTTRRSGTGLGLSIVRRMLTDCQGSIRAESEPGIGTRFIVAFPAGRPGGETGSAPREP
jgi:signal transduction histidine kinase